jgi:hypothetical protein
LTILRTDGCSGEVDKDRSHYPLFYADNNGAYFIQTTDLIDVNFQGLRACTFRIVPDNTPLEGKDLYLLGEFTGYKLNESPHGI